MTPTLRSFSSGPLAAALLLLVVVALLGSASVRAETACSCGGRANTATGTAHCASGYSTRSAVVRGYVAAIKEQNESVRYTITVREVLFNNANAPLAFGNSMYVFASSNPAACGTFLNYHTEYFLRAIHITDVDFSMNNCDYREITSSAKTTTNSLACGRSLGECDRYPCEASRPCSLSPTRITCTNNNGAPCPQRVCGTSVCTGVICPPITCPNPVVVGCCRQCGTGAIVSASAVFVLVLALVSLALSM